MKLTRIFAVAVGCLLATQVLSASGRVGIYGIVERVVFEPNETAPERVQVWGAFAYVDQISGNGLIVSEARRGYLYFALPTYLPQSDTTELVKREWADLKSVAGTGQAVGFGRWNFIGGFSGLQPGGRSDGLPYILQDRYRGGDLTDLRVRPASEVPTEPAAYQTNIGVVKLSAQGRHAVIIKMLKDALVR